MTRLDSDHEELDLHFDPDFVKPRSGLHGLTKVLIGATVLVGGVVILPIAINNYKESVSLRVANEEPVIHADAAAGIGDKNILAQLDASQKDAYMPNRSELRQVNEPVEHPLRLSDMPAVSPTSDIEQGPIVSANLSSVDQKPTPVPVFSDTEITAVPRQNVARQTTDTAPPLEVTEIALPENALALSSPPLISPKELAAKSSALPQVPSLVEQQPAMTDSAVWRVQLISLSSLQNAEAVWTRLQQANRDLLRGLTLHVQQADLSKGTFYRVQAGPLKDQATAASLCNSLKSRNQDCLIVVP